jgi:hypothetical protein
MPPQFAERFKVFRFQREELSELPRRAVTMDDIISLAPKSPDEILSASLQNPLEGVLVPEQDETIKFYTKAVTINEGAAEAKVGQFILTNKRYVFHAEDNHREQVLSNVTNVSVDYDYVIGAISLGLPEITQGWMHVMKISTIEKDDLISLIPNDEALTKNVAEALRLLGGVEKESIPKPEAPTITQARFVMAPTRHRPWGVAIDWQQGEYPITASKAKEFVETQRNRPRGDSGKNGYLVLTNQRIIFAAKVNSLSEEQTVTYVVNLEAIASVSHDKFGFNDKLVVTEESNIEKGFVEPDIQAMIEPTREAIARRRLEVDELKKRVESQSQSIRSPELGTLSNAPDGPKP